MAKSCLEGDGRPRVRSRAPGVCGRDGRQHLSSPALAWSPKGERARCSVPRNRGPNTTLLASMMAEGMGPCLAVEGATSRIVFETYIEKVLLPSLRHGQVVVMDTSVPTRASGSESSSRARAASYSICRRTHRTSVPLKRPSRRSNAFFLCKVEARSREAEALVEAIGKALDAISARDARGFFEHCGYRASGQLF